MISLGETVARIPVVHGYLRNIDAKNMMMPAIPRTSNVPFEKILSMRVVASAFLSFREEEGHLIQIAMSLLVQRLDTSFAEIIFFREVLDVLLGSPDTVFGEHLVIVEP